MLGCIVYSNIKTKTKNFSGLMAFTEHHYYLTPFAHHCTSWMVICIIICFSAFSTASSVTSTVPDMCVWNELMRYLTFPMLSEFVQVDVL